MILSNLFIVGIGFLISLVILFPGLNMLKKQGILTENYLKEKTVSSAGLIIVTATIITWIVLGKLTLLKSDQWGAMIFGILIMAGAGLVDDLGGDRRVKGLKGHLGYLLKGRFTSGMFKAMTGIILALVVCRFWSTNYTIFIINFLLVLLAINTLNLFDLRPGRASKVFLISAWLLLVFSNTRQSEVYLLSTTGVVAAYLPADLNSRAMLGDAGSNVLGYILGLVSVWVLPTNWKVIVLTFLVILHLYTEKNSLTDYIAKNRLLNFLDLLGRTSK